MKEIYTICGNFIKKLSKANIDRNTLNMICKMVLSMKDNSAKLYSYTVKGKEYKVIVSNKIKMVVGDDYNLLFNKDNGRTIRFGKTVEDNPLYSPIGPEILDLEISVNGCPKIGGINCLHCYKGNTSAPPTNMSLQDFRNILDKFPKHLTQIAFGITGVLTNPDFPSMLEMCRNEYGIVPNFTTNGIDAEKFSDIGTKYCGAISVSRYSSNPQVCYDAVREYHNASIRNGRKVDINIHCLVGGFCLDDAFKTVEDIKNGKVEGLNAVVFLKAKPVGRATVLDCKVPKEKWDELIRYCLDNNIKFGADSCSANEILRNLKDRKNMNLDSIERCESGRFSSYVNVNGIYRCCSFCENVDWVKGFDVKSLKDDLDFIEKWNSKEISRNRDVFTRYVEDAKASCPVYRIDT